LPTVDSAVLPATWPRRPAPLSCLPAAMVFPLLCNVLIVGACLTRDPAQRAGRLYLACPAGRVACGASSYAEGMRLHGLTFVFCEQGIEFLFVAVVVEKIVQLHAGL